MRLLAAIMDPSVARRILEYLELSSRAPPVVPAHEIDAWTVVCGSALESTHAEADEDSGFDFDQSPVEDPTRNDEG